MQEKFIEFVEVLIGINKFDDVVKYYKEVFNISLNIEQKIRIWLVLLKIYIVNQRFYDFFDIVEIVEFYVFGKRFVQVYEFLVKIFEKNLQFEEVNKKILEVEGYY